MFTTAIDTTDSFKRTKTLISGVYNLETHGNLEGIDITKLVEITNPNQLVKGQTYLLYNTNNNQKAEGIYLNTYEHTLDFEDEFADEDEDNVPESFFYFYFQDTNKKNRKKYGDILIETSYNYQEFEDTHTRIFIPQTEKINNNNKLKTLKMSNKFGDDELGLIEKHVLRRVDVHGGGRTKKSKRKLRKTKSKKSKRKSKRKSS